MELTFYLEEDRNEMYNVRYLVVINGEGQYGELGNRLRFQMDFRIKQLWWRCSPTTAIVSWPSDPLRSKCFQAIATSSGRCQCNINAESTWPALPKFMLTTCGFMLSVLLSFPLISWPLLLVFIKNHQSWWYLCKVFFLLTSQKERIEFCDLGWKWGCRWFSSNSLFLN